jgi:phospholipid/cholesterol/gamma-HCH transport system ATP-binding protein
VTPDEPPRDDRRGADAGEGPGRIRRTDDTHRIRAAIRTELETHGEPGPHIEEVEHAKPGEHQRKPEGTPASDAKVKRKPGQTVISLEHVSLAFDEPILEDVSFAVKTGETIVVVGESGTGKSTILKLLLRLLTPDSGRVCIDGEDITALSFDEALKVRQKMGMVFQGAALFDSMTVFENIAYPLREHTALSEEQIEERVAEKLSFVDLDPEKVMDQMPSELSGGMKKRVGIARGMANNPDIMLYDEPTSGLDPLTTATITSLILKLQRELGATSVVVSHDIRSAFRMGSKIALLAGKKIKFFGTPEEMSGSDDKYIRDFLGGS